MDHCARTTASAEHVEVKEEKSTFARESLGRKSGNFDFSRPEYPGEKIRYHVTASSNQVPLPRSRESRINTPARRWTRSQRGEKGASAVIILTQAQNISAFKNKPRDYIGECEASDNAISRHLREARERVCPHLPFAGERGDVPYTGLGRSAEAYRNPESGTPVSLISTSRPRVGGGGGHRVPFCPSGFTGSILPILNLYLQHVQL
ncbi:hypothetical protein EAG_14277 [Camponotus floridanus]|uniref:Uncharacterized protein n=1 Tax=Camponotus floridanus TaxID=104421 RepID=E2A4E7_CAMFO|nr:hypothetical protein EAG_14277 [Camponotus floridanus]